MKNAVDIKAIQLADYRQPSYWARSVHMTFELDPHATRVISAVDYEHSPGHSHELELNGKELTLKAVRIDGKALPVESLRHDREHLYLDQLPARFRLEIETEINPKANTALEGLYLSNGAFFTQKAPFER